MKAFRVREPGVVESYIAWIRMDGTAFVLVGGSNRPYLTVSPKLAPPHEPSGKVVDCDFRLTESGMELIPVEQKEERSLNGRALIIVPSGGYDFQVERAEQMPYVPRFANCARAVVLAPNEQIMAYPRVRTLKDAVASSPLCLKLDDGLNVTFHPIE